MLDKTEIFNDFELLTMCYTVAHIYGQTNCLMCV